jgi:hypothetical protein
MRVCGTDGCVRHGQRWGTSHFLRRETVSREVYIAMEFPFSFLSVSASVLAIIVSALLSRVLYMQKFHPLSNFPGPWYASSFSLFGALVSVRHKEPEFFMYLVRKYGSGFSALQAVCSCGY